MTRFTWQSQDAHPEPQDPDDLVERFSSIETHPIALKQWPPKTDAVDRARRTRPRTYGQNHRSRTRTSPAPPPPRGADAADRQAGAHSDRGDGSMDSFRGSVVHELHRQLQVRWLVMTEPRRVSVRKGIVAIALYVASIAFIVLLQSNPSSVLWWPFGTLVVGLLGWTTVRKLQDRTEPIDTVWVTHFKYGLLGAGMVGVCAVEAISASDQSPLARAGLSLAAFVGLVMVIAAVRDYRRWLQTRSRHGSHAR